MVASPVGKENAPPVAQTNNSEKDSKVQNNASLAIIQKQDHILNFQKWWSEGHGNEVAASHALLHIVDPDVLAEVISAGAAYHTCLGIEKLDTLLNKLEEAAGDTALDPLRKAMQTKGGARNQARAVGALLFNTARLVYEDGKGGPSVNLSSGKALFVGDKVCKTETNSEEMGRFDHSAPDSIESPLLPRERVDSNSPTRLGTTAAGAANEPSLEHLPIADAEQEPYEEKVEKDAEAAAAGASTEEAILEQQDQIQRFQLWWAEGKGKEAAGLHPMLSLLDAAVLADIIAAGANYHNCLSADRLDALQRHTSKSNGPGLEALQRALQAKGGAKSQARAVGSVIFKEAMDMFKNPPTEMSKSSLATSSESRELELSGGKVEQPKLNAGVVADEIFEPPKRFICSESFPPEATVAVRLEPNKASSLVTSLPYGSEVLATAARGTYLQFKLDKGQNNEVQYVWVPRVLDGLVLFVEKSDPVKVEKDAEAAAAVASTEEAILEQQDQIQRFQLWWAEGKGKEAAGLHPMLSLLDAAVLADIIAAGANYHNCLSADRLDALQRHTSKSNGPGLEALQRALQAKGGAKSQARAVGSVIFKEAMDMFKNPPAEMSKSSLATSSESRELEQSGGKVEQPKLNAGVVADEIFEPPKRFICSESFPPEATVAVRAAPSHQSEYLTCFPHGTEIYSTGRFGDFLRFRLAKEGTAEAYVPLMFRGLTLFVPGSLPSRGNVSPSGSEERLAQLEDRVSHQETIIKALQAELSALRAHMSAVATAFGTLASRSS